MTVFSDALTQGHNAAISAAGVEINYQHGTTILTFNALVGRTSFDVTNIEGFDTQSQSKDFKFLTSNLVDGLPFLPAKGDTITQTIGDTIYHYEVLRLAADDQVYTLSGPDNQLCRVHTKLVNTEFVEGENE
jgi:hypothetical protein